MASGLFTPEELHSMGLAARASLGGRCDVLRKTRVRQPNGSWKDTTVTVGSNIPCRKVPAGQTPSEQIVMRTSLGQDRGVATFIFEGVLEMSRDDIVRYPTGVGGKEFQVVAVLDRTDGEYVRAMVYDDSMLVAP